MRLLEIVRRLLSAGALLLIAGLAVSVMTADAWLLVGHVAGAVGAVMAAAAVLILMIVGLRQLAQASPRGVEDTLMPHELGLTGLDTDISRNPASSGFADKV